MNGRADVYAALDEVRQHLIDCETSVTLPDTPQGRVAHAMRVGVREAVNAACSVLGGQTSHDGGIVLNLLRIEAGIVSATAAAASLSIMREEVLSRIRNGHDKKEDEE